MSTIPSLALIPSGVKASKVYSVLPTDGSGDFDFTRSGNATRINKEGLIELVSSNVPRLNYPLIDGVVSGCPSLLLEPSRTNLVTYSESFDNAYWTKNGSSVTSGFISPDGTTNAFKLVEDTSTGSHKFRTLANIVVSSGYKTISYYVKYIDKQWVRVFDDFTGVSAFFDILNGVVGSTTSAEKSGIEELSDGWYRIYVVATNVSLNSYPSLFLADSDSSFSYTGDGTSGIYIWGAQLEQGSYATSYIPTQGSIGTRVAESCSQTTPSGIIGQTGGTIYTELNMNNIGINFIFSIDNGGISDFIILDTNSIGELGLQLRQSSGSITTIISGSALIEGNNKIAIRYKSGDYSLYLNGVLQGTSASTLFPSGTISRLSLGANSSFGFLSNSVKDFKLYDTPLSNDELQQLTS